MEARSLPEYRLAEELSQQGTLYWIVGQDTSVIPENVRATFEKSEEATHS